MKSLMIIAASLFLCSCGVNDKQIEYAQLLCKDHGGVWVLHGSFSGDVKVTCRDLIYIEGKVNNETQTR